MRKFVLISSIMLIAACTTTQTVEPVVSDVASAALMRADGSAVGFATLSQRNDGLWLSVTADAPGAGSFGMHVHSVGRCDRPDFTSAGPHWNPAMKQHGRENPMGAHAGDLPNATATLQGKLIIETQLVGATIPQVMDTDGASVVIHEKADDYRTDPSGNSGMRLICGILKRN